MLLRVTRDAARAQTIVAIGRKLCDHALEALTEWASGDAGEGSVPCCQGGKHIKEKRPTRWSASLS